MSGNVYEWVSDWYDSDYYKNSPKDNPKGPNSDPSRPNRVLRGGSWHKNARDTRTANRYYYHPVPQNVNFGFRLVSTQ